MTFATFSKQLSAIEPVSSRLEMTELLAALYTSLDHQEIPAASYIMQGQLVPTYQSLEFNISSTLLLRALARLQSQSNGGSTDLFGQVADDQELAAVQQLYKKLGDVGAVAEEVVSEKSSALSLLEVYEALRKIALEEGSGSQERKISQLVALFNQVEPISARYIARIVVGKLRLGFSHKTMLDALSWAKTGSKDESSLLEEAYNKRADVGRLAQEYLQTADSSERQEMLQTKEIEIGIPVVPALCQRLNSSAEIVEKMGEVVAEPKYDGLRIQIHVDKNNTEQPVQAFTRNLENVTHMFPELESGLKFIQATRCVLDAEAIGYDPASGALVEFQKTITRRRKHDVGEKANDVPIRFYVFDVLMVDDTDISNKKLQERKDVLKNLFSENEVYLETPYIVTKDPVELRNFHEYQLELKLEGAVMKQVDSAYQSGRKGWTWVKIKEEEGTSGKLIDTLDVVLMGYYVGRGKRSQFGLGALLAGVVDDERVLSITKIGTGMSEDQLVALKELADRHQSAEQPPAFLVDKELAPDVWVEPAVVLEVAADEITVSPKHAAKVALRFPRLLQVREDKTWQQATSLDEAMEIKRRSS